MDHSFLTDDAVEGRIRDAAQLLLDLCIAATPLDATGGTGPDAPAAGALGLAIQALFVAEIMPAGTIAERIKKPGAITLSQIAMRATGLGAGVGNCLGMIVGGPGMIIAISSFSKAMNLSMTERQNLKPGGPL